MLTSLVDASSVPSPWRVIVAMAAIMSSIDMPAARAIGATLPMFAARSAKVSLPRLTVWNITSATCPAWSADI